MSYKAAHQRMRKVRGSASVHPCVGVPGYPCWRMAAQWAYMHSDPTGSVEWVVDGRSGNGRAMAYSDDPAHYAPMCRRCHMAWDLLPRGGAVD